MKKFILSICIVLGITLFLDSGLDSGLNSGLDSSYGWGAGPSINSGLGLGSDKPGVNYIYRNGEYQGYSIRLPGNHSVYTPKGSTQWIMCTHTSVSVICY